MSMYEPENWSYTKRYIFFSVKMKGQIFATFCYDSTQKNKHVVLILFFPVSDWENVKVRMLVFSCRRLSQSVHSFLMYLVKCNDCNSRPLWDSELTGGHTSTDTLNIKDQALHLTKSVEVYWNLRWHSINFGTQNITTTISVRERRLQISLMTLPIHSFTWLTKIQLFAGGKSRGCAPHSSTPTPMVSLWAQGV